MTASTPTTKSSGASSMAELMAKQSGTPVTFQKRDTVKGIVSKFNKKEMLVNLQAKGEAIVLEKDPRLMKSLRHYVKEGDEVEVTIISVESDSGQPVVSLRRYVDNLVWKSVEELKKSQDQVEVTVGEVTRGGYVVTSDTGLSGFIPNSHTVGQSLVANQRVKVSVADYNKEDRKIIFSQKSTLSADVFEKATALLKKGDKVQVTVVNGTNFGFFVTTPVTIDEKEQLLEGLIHISELTWDKVEEITGMYKVGQTFEASVLGFDKDSKRVDFSVKRLTSDPFEKVKEQFPVDTKVQGTVTKLEDGNVYLELEDGVHGIVKKEKVPPTTTYEVGSKVNATVISHDGRRRRIELSPVLLEKPLMYR